MPPEQKLRYPRAWGSGGRHAPQYKNAFVTKKKYKSLKKNMGFHFFGLPKKIRKPESLVTGGGTPPRKN